MSGLSGHTALVTGASRGLGREIARQLARAGADLVLVGRDRAALESAKEQVAGESGVKIVAIGLDLADADAVAKGLAAISAVDILVNNAAIQGPIGPLDRCDPAAWMRTIQVNLVAPALLCRHVIPAMRGRGRGKIINLSGGGATGPRADFSAYAAAKCGLVRLTETLAEELAGSGIDVNAVAPGAMNTAMLDDVLAAGPDAAPREYAAALGRKRSPPGDTLDRAAALVVHLASSACDGITGKLISAVWDPWPTLAERRAELAGSDLYTLRRIVPADRGKSWGG